MEQKDKEIKEEMKQQYKALEQENKQMKQQYIEMQQKNNQMEQQQFALKQQTEENNKEINDLKNKLEEVLGILGAIQMRDRSKNVLRPYIRLLNKTELEIVENDKKKNGKQLQKK